MNRKQVTDDRGQGTGIRSRFSSLPHPTPHTPHPFRGFTLIETLVAISVLLLSLAGPLSIAAAALKSANYARDEVTAYYLAQEGIEYVRAIRDQNYLSGNTGSLWLNGINGVAGDSCINTNCTVDIPSFTHEACGGACLPLKISESGNLYNTTAGDSSIYTRSLTMTRIDDLDEEAIVTVTMTWSSHNLSRSFQISEHIFNWLQ